MDDLDLEKLKQELDDVSGGSCYDVNDILREAGADTPEADGEELEQLMKQFGITVEAETAPITGQAPTAPVQTDTRQDEDEPDDILSGIHLAAQQTESLAAQQDAMAQEAKADTAASDPLAEQEELFAQLFTQLDAIEQNPIDDILESPTQVLPAEQETQVLPVTELYADEPEELDEPAEPEEPEQFEQSEIVEQPVDEPEAVEQPDEPEEADEDELDEYEEEAPKKGFFARLFGFDEDDEDDEEEADEIDEAEPEDEREALEQPEEQNETEPFDEAEDEPEALEESDEPEEADEDELDEYEEEAPRKSFFARLFGFDEDDEEDEYDEEPEDEIEISDEPENEPEAVEELEASEMEVDEVETADEPEDEPEVVEAADEPEEELEEVEEPEASELEPDEVEVADEPEDEPEEIEVFDEQPEELDEPEDTDIEDAQPEEPVHTEDAGVAAFADALAQEAAVEVTEETPEPPRPRPEDTPVISEAELEAFLSSVKLEDDAPHATFEQLLRDNGIAVEETEPKQQKISLEEFPDEETTVYFDIPVRESAEEQSEPRQPQLFDIEAEDEAFAAQTPQDEAEEQEEPAQPEDEPITAPDWLGMPLEQVCKQAPPLEELRREGPVMAREVARQKDWLLERIRAYQQSMKPETEQQDEPEEIHAAEELHALQEQESDEERDSVFPDRSVDKPETESADRESTLTDAKAALQETQQIILTLPVKQKSEPEHEPQQTDEAETSATQQPETAVRLETKPKAKPQPKSRPKPRRAAEKKPRETWPQEEPPQDVRRAEKSWRLRTQQQARRSIPVLICALLATYISCADDFSLLPLPASLDYISNPVTVLQVLVVLQIVAMLFAYDVIWDGIQAAIHMTPNFSTLVDLAMLLNIIHCAVRMAAEGEEIPFACMALLALFAQLRAKCAFSSTRHYAFKTAANAHQPMGLFYHNGKRPHLVKAPLENVHRFAQQTVQPDENWKQERIMTILAVILSVVLSVIVCVSTGDMGRIWYVLAATITGACQISLLGAAAMAHKHAARHMAKNGSAVIGRRGARKIASADAIVLTDDDLFPAGTIALQRLELRSSLNDSTALAYAAALAGDSSLGHMLAEEVRARYGAALAAHHVVYYTGGGIGGHIGGLEVLLGDKEFMAQRGIIVRDVPENGLVLALDNDAAAVLVIDYIVPAAQYTAMHELTERNLTILLHTRNQQVTPELVERLYALKKGTVIVPELEQDRAMHDPRYTEKDMLCGILVRDGFVPLAGCVSTAKEQTQFTRAGGWIGVCAAVICMLLMTYLCYVFVPTDARPIRMLFYAILCFIPIFFLENGVGRD